MAYKYGKSITTIAALTGLSIGGVSRALSGRGTNLRTAQKLAKAMGISLDEFWARFYAETNRAA